MTYPPADQEAENITMFHLLSINDGNESSLSLSESGHLTLLTDTSRFLDIFFSKQTKIQFKHYHQWLSFFAQLWLKLFHEI